MFGMTKTTPQLDPDREREIEQKKKTVRLFIEGLRDTTPEEAAHITDKLKPYLQNDKILPLEFKQKAFEWMRQLECEANMRAADRLIHEAASLLGREQMRERGQKLSDSRRYFGKVCALGADMEWKNAYQRLCETVMLSGNVQREGPTKAKPLDTAPKAPNRAKT
jgi:hypothetical protein